MMRQTVWWFGYLRGPTAKRLPQAVFDSGVQLA